MNRHDIPKEVYTKLDYKLLSNFESHIWEITSLKNVYSYFENR